MVGANRQVILVGKANPIFTITFALIAAKYGAKAFGGKAAATQVGIASGGIVDAGIVAWIVRR